MLEINTRKAGDREAREADLLESLAFSRVPLRHRPRKSLECQTAARRAVRGAPARRPDTRADILVRLRAPCSPTAGFGRTTIRAVASDAGVDPALVHHYFGTKDDLFVASLQLPVDPRERLAPALAGGPDGAAERILRVFLEVWDEPDNRLALLGLVRSILDGTGERLLREGFLPVVLIPVGQALGIDRPELRMPLVASQLVGLILVRYVLAVEPLASMAADDIIQSSAMSGAEDAHLDLLGDDEDDGEARRDRQPATRSGMPAATIDANTKIRTRAAIGSDTSSARWRSFSDCSAESLVIGP